MLQGATTVTAIDNDILRVKDKGTSQSLVVKKLHGTWSHDGNKKGDLHVLFATNLVVPSKTNPIKWDNAVIMIDASDDNSWLTGVNESRKALRTQLGALYGSKYAHGDIYEKNIKSSDETLVVKVDRDGTSFVVPQKTSNPSLPYLIDFSYQNGSVLIQEQTLQNVKITQKARDFLSVSTVQHITR